MNTKNAKIFVSYIEQFIELKIHEAQGDTSTVNGRLDFIKTTLALHLTEAFAEQRKEPAPKVIT